MNKTAVAFTLFRGELSRRLDKRQRFDVARSSADFGYKHVRALAARLDKAFYFARHVRYYLHGLTEVFAGALAGKHAFVNSARREVAGF